MSAHSISRLSRNSNGFGYRKPNHGLAAKGSVLALCLWVICFLSFLAVTLSYQVRQRLSLIKRLEERDKLHFMAEAALKRAIAVIKKEPLDGYDFLREEWSDNPLIFKDVNAEGGVFSVCYGDSGILDGEAALITRYGLIDEERKINLNSSGQDVIERLFRVGLGMDDMLAQELAAGIKDWRDKDSELSIPVGSAEDFHYRGLNYPYDAKDGDMETLDELLLVNGMTKDIFERIKDYVTIWGSGMVNINTAPQEVLLAVGLNQSLVDKILSFRGGSDEREGGFFSGLSEVSAKLSQTGTLNDSELALLNLVAGRALTVSSSSFMVKARIRLSGRVQDQEALSVIDKKGGVLYWREP
mgnify:FL=1